MKKIALLGANGQVAYEVCRLLKALDKFIIVPIVRNRSGSALLRNDGFDVRHGLITDDSQASQLIGDCDIILNFALSTTGIPSYDYKINKKIVENSVRYSKKDSIQIFISTIMVYSPNTFLRFPDFYGLMKLSNEHLHKRLCRRMDKKYFIFRLGHVLGDYQGFTKKIINEIRTNRILKENDVYRFSNSVFTAEIAQTVLQVADNNVIPGTYDLISEPQWPWYKVYSYYADNEKIDLIVEKTIVHKKSYFKSFAKRIIQLLSAQYLRERLFWLLHYLPYNFNKKIYFQYLKRKAFSQINYLAEKKNYAVIPIWRNLKVRKIKLVKRS